MHLLGFMYATGIGNAVEPDQGAVTPPLPHNPRNSSNSLFPQLHNIAYVIWTDDEALLYHTFAAMAGNTRSEMTIAYRHLMGIGTPRSCEDAVYYYKRVADKCTVRTSPLNRPSPLL